MKIFNILILLSIVAFTLTVDLESAFIRGEIKTSAIQEFFQTQFLPLIEEIVPCLNIKKIEEKVEKPLFKLDVVIEDLKVTKMVLPKENYRIQFYHGTSGLDVARQRCEAENSQGCELVEDAYYPKCKEHFKGEKNHCVATCPAEFSDWGLTCAKPKPYGRGTGYPWKIGDGNTLEKAKQRCLKDHPELGCQKVGEIYYPNCRAGFHNVGCCVCSPNCPSGYKDIGEFCEKPSRYERKKYQDVDQDVMVTTLDHFDVSLSALLTVTIDGVTNVNKGQLTIVTSDSNFYGRLGIGLQEGSLQFHFEKTDLTLNNFNIEIHGQFSEEVLNALLNLLEGTIKKTIQTLFDSMGTVIQPLINKALIDIPKKIPIGKKGLSVEYSLLEAPETQAELVKFYLNGTINFAPAPAQQQLPQNTEQATVDKDDDVLISINKNGINEILQHAFNAGILSFTQELNYSALGVHINKITVTPIKYAPYMVIKPHEASLNATTEFKISMKFGEHGTYSEHNIIVELIPYLDVAVVDNGFKFSITKVTIVDFQVSDKIPIPKNVLLTILNSVIGLMVPVINKLVPTIKLPTIGGVSYQSNKFEFKQDHIEFQTKIIFEQKFHENIKKIIFAALVNPVIQKVVPIENICKKEEIFTSY